MSGPFDHDFLRTKPGWLSPTNPLAKPVAIANNPAVTIAPASTLQAAAGLIVTLAFCAAATLGKPNVQGATYGATHGEDAVAVSAVVRSDAELAWEDYLARLARGRFAASHVDTVRKVWTHLRTLNNALAPPQTAPTEDGALAMVWDSGPHHVEVEVHPTDVVEWFYSNRTTGEYEGEDDNRPGNLGHRLSAHIRKLV